MEIKPSLIPTMPTSNASATRQTRPSIPLILVSHNLRQAWQAGDSSGPRFPSED